MEESRAEVKENKERLVKRHGLITYKLQAFECFAYSKGLLQAASLRLVVEKEDWNCRRDGRLPN